MLLVIVGILNSYAVFYADAIAVTVQRAFLGASRLQATFRVLPVQRSWRAPETISSLLCHIDCLSVKPLDRVLDLREC